MAWHQSRKWKLIYISGPNASNGDGATPESGGHYVERITFNFGREIFVYPYKGVKKAADLTKPIDKRIYKGTCPTCHDFGPVSDQSDIIPLLVGFSGGQIQLIDPIRKELSKLYNEEVSKYQFYAIFSPNVFLLLNMKPIDANIY